MPTSAAALTTLMWCSYSNPKNKQKKTEHVLQDRKTRHESLHCGTVSGEPHVQFKCHKIRGFWQYSSRRL